MNTARPGYMSALPSFGATHSTGGEPADTRASAHGWVAGIGVDLIHAPFGNCCRITIASGGEGAATEATVNEGDEWVGDAAQGSASHAEASPAGWPPSPCCHRA